MTIGLISGCATSGPPEQDPLAKSWAGRKAPSFQFETIEDEEIALNSYRNEKMVILNFFGTWCPPCRTEMPALQDYYDRYSDEVVVIGISLNEKNQEVRRFMNELNLQFPAGLDYEKKEDSIYRRYEVPTLPTTVVIDRQGKVAYYKPGMLQSHHFQYLEDLIVEED